MDSCAQETPSVLGLGRTGGGQLAAARGSEGQRLPAGEVFHFPEGASFKGLPSDGLISATCPFYLLVVGIRYPVSHPLESA